MEIIPAESYLLMFMEFKGSQIKIRILSQKKSSFVSVSKEDVLVPNINIIRSKWVNAEEVRIAFNSIKRHSKGKGDRRKDNNWTHL